MSKLINNFSIDNLVFSEVKKNSKGGKYVLMTDNGQDIYLQLPALPAPFGLSEPHDEVKEYSLSLSLTDETVLQKMKEIEDQVILYVAEYSKDIFGKVIDKNVLRDVMFNPIVKMPKDDGKYPPTMKLKASTGNGKYTAEFYRSSKEKLELSDITKGSRIETIIKIGQIWVIDKKFGVSLKLEQAKVHMSTKISGYAFTDDEEVIDLPDDE